MTTELISMERSLLKNVTETPRLFVEIAKEACIERGSDWGNKYSRGTWARCFRELIDKVGLKRTWDEQGNTLVSK